MIPTKQIREALAAHLESLGTFEKVMTHSETDLTAALEHLRDSPDSLAVIVPGDDTFIHQITEGYNTPEFCETRNQFELLIAARELDMRSDGVPNVVDLKDSTCAALLWENLSIPGLISLPLRAEPIVIEIDERRGREAWKITLECRHLSVG